MSIVSIMKTLRCEKLIQRQIYISQLILSISTQTYCRNTKVGLYKSARLFSTYLTVTDHYNIITIFMIIIILFILSQFENIPINKKLNKLLPKGENLISKIACVYFFKL